MKKKKMSHCSGCGKPFVRKSHGHCPECHAAYQRKHRAKMKRERMAVARFLKRSGVHVGA